MENFDLFPMLVENKEANFALIVETMGIIILNGFDTESAISIGDKPYHPCVIFPSYVITYREKSCWSGFTLGGGIAVHLVVNEGSMMLPGFLLLIGE